MSDDSLRIDDPALVRAAVRTERPAQARVAAAAFAPTDLWAWIIPDGSVRTAMLAAALRREIDDVHARDGQPLVAGPDGSVVATALWCAPGQAFAAPWRSLLVVPAILRAARGPGGRTALKEFEKRGPRVDRALRKAHPEEPHWYLGMLAVDPGAQATGLGSALVRVGLERADREGVPCYLECEEHLVGYYSRFGFATPRRIDPGAGAPALFGMWRPVPTTGPDLAR